MPVRYQESSEVNMNDWSIALRRFESNWAVLIDLFRILIIGNGHRDGFNYENWLRWDSHMKYVVSNNLFYFIVACSRL